MWIDEEPECALRPLRGRMLFWFGCRWYRCAQPPANSCDPSGIKCNHLFYATNINSPILNSGYWLITIIAMLFIIDNYDYMIWFIQ